MEFNDKEIFSVISKYQGDYSRAHFILVSEFLYQGQNSIVRDLDCNLILSFLVFKALKSMSKRNVNYSYDEILNINLLEPLSIKKSEIAEYLNVPRETVRRKINKLIDHDLIKISNKQIFVKTKLFNNINILRYEKYLEKCLEVLTPHLKINNNYDSNNKFKINLKKNFSFIWCHFLDTIVYISKIWRNYHRSLESWYIFGTCSLNQMYNVKEFKVLNEKRKESTENFFVNLTEKNNTRGLNPTTLSELTGLPRATVMRHLEKLIKNKTIKKNPDNLYFIPGVTNQKKNIIEIIEKVKEKSAKLWFQTIRISC